MKITSSKQTHKIYCSDNYYDIPDSYELEDRYYVDQIYEQLKDNETALEEYGNGDPNILYVTLENVTGNVLYDIIEEYGLKLKLK